MPDVLVRDLDVLVIDNIKAKAKRRNRSLQAQMKIILCEAAEKPETVSEIEALKKFRASIKPQSSDAVDLLREDRGR